MDINDQQKALSMHDALCKAKEILSGMEESTDKTHGLLLTYNAEKELFQMLAINSDLSEVKRLLISCVAALQGLEDNLSDDRVIN